MILRRRVSSGDRGGRLERRRRRRGVRRRLGHSQHAHDTGPGVEMCAAGRAAPQSGGGSVGAVLPSLISRESEALVSGVPNDATGLFPHLPRVVARRKPPTSVPMTRNRPPFYHAKVAVAITPRSVTA